MLGLNHTTTAALIAVTIKTPELAIPLALASHFALDIIPHHGNDAQFEHGSAKFWPKIALDASLSLVVVAAVMIARPQQAVIIAACAFAAILPDLLWPIAWQMKRKDRPLWAFFKFHKGIQHESRKGVWVEYAWAAVSGGALLLIR